MPRKKRKRSKAGASTAKQDTAQKKLQLDPEVGRSIASVVSVLIGLLLILAIVGLAGTVGVYIFTILQLLFGWGLYLVPVLLFGFAANLLRERAHEQSKTAKNLIGVPLFLLSLFGLIHVGQAENIIEAVRTGEGGGYIGLLLSFPLFMAFGIWASALILSALFFISLLLMFNVSLGKIMSLINFLKRPITQSDEHNEEATAGADSAPEVNIQGMRAHGFRIKKPGSQKELKIDNRMEREPLHHKKEETHEPITSQLNQHWKLPSLDLLDDTLSQPTSGDIKKNAQIIKDTLHNFSVPVEMDTVSIGPTVTQYTLRPAVGVRLNQIVARQNDLALALAAHPIRIEAPIPGKSLAGIEVPNKTVATVRLREILESKEMQKKKSNLTLALGRDVAGNPIAPDLEKMPHMLIAGATGSGKSVCLNTILLSLLYQNSPQDMRLILVDPKRVEFSYFNNIPHLLSPVIIEPKKTIHALKWVISEMDRRYKLLSETGKKNIGSYNSTAKEDKLPYIVLVIDELADLMSVAASDVEAMIVRLAQMARAVGIHLILATQRPSVDVITGLIKANITTRIAFKVASQIDSRTILDMAGAEKLLGNGDALFVTTDITKPKRVQTAFLSEEDIAAVTNFLREEGKPEYNEEVTQPKKNIRFTESGTIMGEGGEDDVDDDLFEEAKEVVVSASKGSASLLQRRLRIGYARAARLLDLLEEHGIVGPPDGSRPREVLVSANQVAQQNAEQQAMREEREVRQQEQQTQQHNPQQEQPDPLEQRPFEQYSLQEDANQAGKLTIESDDATNDDQNDNKQPPLPKNIQWD
jgi:DNA segregation ATPase FtsK/SpoIIIE, S-DNA-T family